MQRVIVTVSICIYMVLFLCTQGHAIERTVSETVIDTVDFLSPGAKISIEKRIKRVSDDRRRIVTTVQEDRKWYVFIDGKREGMIYDAVESFHFSPDMQRVAYLAKVGAKQFLVVDGKKGNEYDFVFVPVMYPKRDDEFYSVFSPDSRRVVYTAVKEGKCVEVIDGAEKELSACHKPDDCLQAGAFSSDSQRIAIAFTFALGQKPVVVIVDGKEGTPYDFVQDLEFTPDSKHVTYLANRSNQWFLVVDGKEEKRYETDQTPLLSPDKSRVAYLVKGKNGDFVVADGIRGKPYPSIAQNSLVFSPDSKRLAYFTDRFVVVEGHEGKRYDGFEKDPRPIFSPDGQSMAYKASIYQTNNGKTSFKQLIVVDEKEHKAYECSAVDYISDPIFSPDSKRIAYTVTVGGKQFAVVDGQELIKYKQTEKSYLGEPVFSPDSKRVAYVVAETEKDWFVVIDGQQGKRYEKIIWPVVFVSSNTIRYMAARGGNIYSVEETLK